MEATKKVTGKSVKKWLGNNAIIVLMLAVSLIVGIIHPNFFALANIINLFKNVLTRFATAKKLGWMMPTIRDTASIRTIMALLPSHFFTDLPVNFLVASTIDSLLVY